MPIFYDITFRPSGEKQEFGGSRGNYYELEDGSYLDVETVPVWCRRCGGITNGEKLGSLDELDNQLADLHDPDSHIYRYLMRPLLPEPNTMPPRNEARLEWIEVIRKRRQWRERRSSAAKCIECGSSDIVMLPIGQPVPHPAGTGTITADVVGLCSTLWNQWFFTPEGDCISRDPNYKKPPAFWKMWDGPWFKSLGKEIGPESCTADVCSRLRIKDSALCLRHHYEQVRQRPCPFDE